MSDDKEYRDLLIEIVKDYELPEGCDSWGIRSVHPDFRSRNGYRWPYPGQVAKAAGPFERANTGGCPDQDGDGICFAKTWRGMASGSISALTLLLVAYSSAHVLGSDGDVQKYRVEQCRVIDVIDGAKLVREHGKSANLRYADLRGANLRYANLKYANLRGADLSGADLKYANLRGADLYGADLRGADLSGADLRGADLYGADLYGANRVEQAYVDEWTRLPGGFVVRDGVITRSDGV